MNRGIFLLHRYLGIALGLLMLVWCLSGIVMMYVQFPALSSEENLRGPEQLDLTDCCELPPTSELAEIDGVDGVRIEMMASRPVMRISGGSSGESLIDLSTGAWLDAIGVTDADEISAIFAENYGIDSFRQSWIDERDQWTVYGGFNRHRPLLKYSADDESGTQWYVSSRTGEVVQLTTRSERFWNWLGAVPHWLYPTILRQNTLVWSRIVIWSTILGMFLTVFGLYVGIRQYKSRRSGRYSPYRGAALWHHYAGLTFGVLTLTWLLSGFFSMNPWGALESRSFAAELGRHHGSGLTLDAEFLRTLVSLSDGPVLENAARLEIATVGGKRYFLVWDSSGQRRRLSGDLSQVGPIDPASLEQLGLRLRPEVEIEDAGWLEQADAYYYSHHDKREFPVYRIRYADGERYYLDSVTGDLVYAVDDNSRMYRWLHYGLHRGDFRFIRSRPVWDILMLILMAGVTVGAVTGSWMGIRRMRRSLSKLTVTPASNRIFPPGV